MPRTIKDLIGRKFGRLTVHKLVHKSNQGKDGNGTKTTWECVCECGSGVRKHYTTNNLIAGNAKSCGCLAACHRTGSKNWKWRGGRTRSESGYVTVRVWDYPGTLKSISIHEHVYVMAKFLGRPIREKESIHHKNGVRDDNRLENLELWSCSQPRGQRVVDKIQWAKEILETYKDFEQ